MTQTAPHTSNPMWSHDILDCITTWDWVNTVNPLFTQSQVVTCRTTIRVGYGSIHARTYRKHSLRQCTGPEATAVRLLTFICSPMGVCQDHCSSIRFMELHKGQPCVGRDQPFACYITTKLIIFIAHAVLVGLITKLADV